MWAKEKEKKKENRENMGTGRKKERKDEIGEEEKGKSHLGNKMRSSSPLLKEVLMRGFCKRCKIKQIDIIVTMQVSTSFARSAVFSGRVSTRPQVRFDWQLRRLSLALI